MKYSFVLHCLGISVRWHFTHDTSRTHDILLFEFTGWLVGSSCGDIWQEILLEVVDLRYVQQQPSIGSLIESDNWSWNNQEHPGKDPGKDPWKHPTSPVYFAVSWDFGLVAGSPRSIIASQSEKLSMHLSRLLPLGLPVLWNPRSGHRSFSLFWTVFVLDISRKPSPNISQFSGQLALQNATAVTGCFFTARMGSNGVLRGHQSSSYGEDRWLHPKAFFFIWLFGICKVQNDFAFFCWFFEFADGFNMFQHFLVWHFSEALVRGATKRFWAAPKGWEIPQ